MAGRSGAILESIMTEGYFGGSALRTDMSAVCQRAPQTQRGETKNKKNRKRKQAASVLGGGLEHQTTRRGMVIYLGGTLNF